MLLRLVSEKGMVWKEIATELGIQGSSMKARRRWETLQPKETNRWSGSEDNALAIAVQEFSQESLSSGNNQLWVSVANQLETNRSPRQCYSRWRHTLLPLQGKAVAMTRFKNIRGWKWETDEVDRLRRARAAMLQVDGLNRDINKVQNSEPWLIIDEDVDVQFPRGFWTFVACLVGTRTSHQCQVKWKTMFRQQKRIASMNIDEAKQLARLVKTYDNQWKMLAERFFPGKSDTTLYYTYSLWRVWEKKHNVDLLAIDPFSMIQEFDGSSALRPTGDDGYYKEGAPLVKVSSRGIPSILTPYYLALQKVRPVSSLDQKVSKSPRILGLSRKGHFGASLSSEMMDKFIAAIHKHKNDWVCISQETGLSISKCRRYAESLSKQLSSIRHLLDGSEIQHLVEEFNEQQDDRLPTKM